jgi:3-dehydroquinate dehydratase-2
MMVISMTALYRATTGRLNGIAMSHLIFLLNGPNLNRLGMREPHIYGHETLDDIVGSLHQRAEALGLTLDARQSNHEGHLVDWLHEAADRQALAVILNPGALTHSSIALRDAIAGMDVPVIEVHLSNTAAREEFRHKSHVSPVAKGVIQGFGALGYRLALDAAAALRQEPDNHRKDVNG